MGTRSLTMVIDNNGQKKVAQYGQWDGYPSGVGIGVLSLLKNKELFDKLKLNLSKVRFLEDEGIDKEFIEDYNMRVPKLYKDPDNRTEEQKLLFINFWSRDLAETVLTNIANSTDEEIVLIDNDQTAMGDGWVEWSYVINIKENTLGVYGHIDEEPIKVYNLDSLPEEEDFISELE